MTALLLLSTTVYFLWFERNNRVFKNFAQPYQTTTESIFQQIRTHLATMGMVGNIPVRICAIWNLHVA
ncbi:hypothetical protein NC652_024519 [Populus alba x Populus x berolinensis]|nr:hypothetical protein NC652_024508 [Populus alba x Populus x berolinensis]KAJ6897726.1 hypothetical protein NC652_024519 [Populus alba x Populus x berolinensis]